jgi:hypothetical protein
MMEPLLQKELYSVLTGQAVEPEPKPCCLSVLVFPLANHIST